MRIDLNADVGEGMDDAPLMPLLTSANVACGLHAGSPAVMDRTLTLARDKGVRVGAHPGYADRENFGRTNVKLADEEVRALVVYQVAALSGMAAAHGVRLTHVKAHGALYNQAAKDRRLARVIAESVLALDPRLRLVGLAGSAQIDAARSVGLTPAGEAFADRRYLPDGTLMPRTQPGAVLHDPAEAAQQAVRIARDREVIASDGSHLRVEAETLCLHGDTDGALAIARAVRDALEEAGVTVAPLF